MVVELFQSRYLSALNHSKELNVIGASDKKETIKV